MKITKRDIFAYTAGMLIPLAFLIPQSRPIAIIAALLSVMIYWSWVGIKMFFMDRCNVVYDCRDGILMRKNKSGRVLASIDITKEYKALIPHVELEYSYYRVEQGNQIVEFTSRADNAEYLVVDILKIKGGWPPGGHCNVSLR